MVLAHFKGAVEILASVSLHAQPEHMGQELCLYLLPFVASGVVARRQKVFSGLVISPGPKIPLADFLLILCISYAAGHDLTFNTILWLSFLSTASGFCSSKLERVYLRKRKPKPNKTTLAKNECNKSNA